MQKLVSYLSMDVNKPVSYLPIYEEMLHVCEKLLVPDCNANHAAE